MKMKRTIKRVVSSLLCTVVVITSLPGLEAMADTSYTAIASRADVDVPLRMGVIADSQYTAGAGTAKLDAALQVLNEIDADYDGLAMVGDIVYQSSSTAVKTDVYDMLDTSLNTYAKNGEEVKPYIFAMGNHEFPLNLKVASNAALVQTAKETYKSRYCPDAEYDSTTNEGPYINQVFGATETNTGYHFITAAPIDYSNQLSTTSENWVLEQVDAAIAEDANKPVFLLLHQPIQNTAYGSSTVRYSDEFKSELQKRPQVVVLSGHTHYATNDPRMIWQDGFTLAMIGCTGGGMNARYADYAEGNEVTLLEVDENNVVKFYRVDVNSKQYIGEPWELDIPAMVADAEDGVIDTSVWKYTSVRTEEAVTPEFSDTAGIAVSSISAEQFTVGFPQLRTAEGSNDVIVGYRVQVLNMKTQQQVQQYNVSSDYYTSTKADTVTTTISKLAASTKYIVNVYAISAFGKVSEKPLTRTIRTKEAEGTTTAVTDNRETISQNVGEATASTCERKWGNTSWGFYESGEYATYTFTVPTSGMYELLVVGGSNSGGSFSIQVDGISSDTILVVPDGGDSIKNKISGSFYPLKAGTHTIRLGLNECASTLVLSKVSLAKEDDAVILEVQAKEKTSVSTTSYSDYSSSAGYVAFWNTQTVTFKPTIPKKGTYKIYVDGGAVNTGNTYSVTINGKTLSCDMKQTGAISKFARNELLGAVDLDEGIYTLQVKLNRKSGNVSLRRVIFVQEATKDYKISTEAVDCTTLSGANKAVSSGAGWCALFNQGYISFTVTPEYTGVYDLSWEYAASGLKGTTYVNDEQIDERTFTGGDTSAQYGGVLQSVGEVALEAGKSYMIRLADDGSGTFGIEKMVLTYQCEATLEDGIFLDAYVGDSVSGYTATKYSDGKDTNAGFGFAATLLAEFDMEITQAGLYDVALQLGADSATSVSVFIDGTLLATKENLNYGDYDSRNMESFGEKILREGTYRVKVLCNSGGMQLFKVRMTSMRALTDTDPYSLTIPAISHDSYYYTGSSKQDGASAIVLANTDSYTQYDVELPAGNYVFSIRYSRAATAKMGLVVNGEAIGNYTLPAASSYTKKAVAVLSLEEGVNSIRLVGSSSYYYYTYIYLEKITSPVSELYNGDYISQEVSVAEEFTREGMTGDFIFRTYLPADMKDQFVQVVGSLYDGDTLVDTVWAEPVMATANSVVIARMKDVELDADKTYTWKVNDYICYSTEDADETGDINLTGNAHNKTAFGVKLVLEDTTANFSYASGVSVALKDNGSLGVTIGGQEVEIAPTEFETFKDQVFELQITTDVTDDIANIGIWIDKKLANQTYHTIAVDTLDGSISCSNDGLLCYTLWKIAKPDVYSADYIELQGVNPYVVEYDSMVYTGDSTVYATGDQTTTIGDYTVNVCGVEYAAILWKGYDLHADGTVDAKDLVSMKKVEGKQTPDSNAGYMAASQLDSAYELEAIRQNLVN